MILGLTQNGCSEDAERPFSRMQFENVNCENRFIQSYQHDSCGRRHIRPAGDKMDPWIFNQALPRPGRLCPYGYGYGHY
jgi:hypothetical protein